MDVRYIVSFVGLLFLAGCVQQPPRPLSSKKYLEVSLAYSSAQRSYEKNLDLLEQYNDAANDRERKALSQALQGQILVAHDRHNAWFDNRSFFQSWGATNPYRHYPFIQYKDALDETMRTLCSSQASLYLTDTQLAHRVDGLLADLEELRQYVVTRSEYQKELQMLEERRIAQEQAAARRAQAAAITTLACSVATHAVATAAPDGRNKTTINNNYQDCQINEKCQVNNIRG